MNDKLYPLKFKPILKEKIWGGNKLATVLNKPQGNLQNIGESWELSGLGEDVSVVSNGFLQDNTIEELIEVYMGDLVGDAVFSKFGTTFPLLFKFIEASDNLSIQVHPNDDVARERHGSFGKTELWYIVEAEKDAKLVPGFSCPMDKQKYLEHFSNGTLRDIIKWEEARPGDVFFIPAGRIHSIGPNILLAEIQQSSDVTYRIYDWDRVDANGKGRELHTDWAVDSIDYSFSKEYRVAYSINKNNSSNIAQCDYFTVNVLDFDKNIEIDYGRLDSFVVYMAVEGKTLICSPGLDEPVEVEKGETVLIPAEMKEIELKPLAGESKLLEIYI